MSKHKLLIWGLIIFIPLTILGIVIIFAPGGTTSSGGSKTSTSGSSAVTSISQTITSAFPEYRLAGVRANGSVVIFDINRQPVVINLTNRKWQSLQWSPDAKYLAALGIADNDLTNPINIYNIFIYDVANNNWKQFTQYTNETGGISGISWWDNQTIAYTQGDKSAIWVHHIDILNNNVKKLFPVNGNLAEVFSGQKYLINDNRNNIYSVFSQQGKPEYAFGDNNVNGKLVKVTFGPTQNDFWVHVSQPAQQTVYSWSFNNPNLVAQYQTTQVLAGVCRMGQSLQWLNLFTDSIVTGSVAFNNQTDQPTANLGANRRLANTNYQVNCFAGNLLLHVNDGNTHTWWWASAEPIEVKQFPQADNLVLVAPRPNVDLAKN
jgi:hypothetical protein